MQPHYAGDYAPRRRVEQATLAQVVATGEPFPVSGRVPSLCPAPASFADGEIRTTLL